MYQVQKIVCASVIRLSWESSYHSQYWKCKFKQFDDQQADRLRMNLMGNNLLYT